MPPSIRTFIDEWFRMASYAIVMLALSGPPTLAESIKGSGRLRARTRTGDIAVGIVVGLVCADEGLAQSPACSERCLDYGKIHINLVI